jgi:hypothetical protein
MISLISTADRSLEAETDGVGEVEGIPVRCVAPDTPQGVAPWLTQPGGSPRMLDWVDEHFGVAGPGVAGGVSMGGDVAVALAGVDPRIDRVAALVATPDWARPGMSGCNPAALECGWRRTVGVRTEPRNAENLFQWG